MEKKRTRCFPSMDSRLIPFQHPCCCLEIGLPTKQVRTVFTPNGNGLHRCLSSCRPQRSNAATRSQPLCFAQHTLLPSIYLSPSFAPLGPSWSREKVQTPGSVPTRTPDRFPNKAFWVPRPSGSPSVALLWGASQEGYRWMPCAHACRSIVPRTLGNG